ncbi:MAG: hypothetical protein ACI81R_000184 [Bradymonadia bacterium]|jgi:cysteine synthase
MPTRPPQLSPVTSGVLAKSYPALPAPPLVGLRRSGAGRIWLKHEGYSAGGSFFDRVVRCSLADASSETIGVVGADAFSYSLAIRAASEGRGVTVFDVSPNERRLRSLLHGVGARVRTFKNSEEVAAATSAFSGELVERHASRPILSALRDVAAEVSAELGESDVHWVLPDFGQLTSELAESLGVLPKRVSTVLDDRERRRELEPSARARRQQVAQREGVLLSPVGAELVESAVGVVDDCGASVVVLIPECGRRFVGWW